MKSKRLTQFFNKIKLWNSKQNNFNYSEKKKNNQDLAARIVVWFFVVLTLFAFASLVGFVVSESLSAFQKYGFWTIMTGKKWDPSGKTQSFGILPFIISTTWICLFAMVFAIPLGILSSLFICEFLPRRLQKLSLTLIELLSGIPSVVFGSFGLMIIGPIFVKLGAPTKENMMTASFILSLMSLPTIIALSVNAIKGVAKANRYASLALGVSQAKTTWKIVFRSAKLKIISAVIFGFGRVIGETMAVIMIAGGSVVSPEMKNGPIGFFFSSVTTLAGIIGIEIGETTDSMHASVLYAVGVFLFIIVTIINIVVLLIYKRSESKKGRSFHFFRRKFTVTHLDDNKIKQIISSKTKKRTFASKSNDILRVSFMSIAWMITMGLIIWIIGDIVLEGIFNLRRQPGESVWNFSFATFFTFDADPATGDGGYLSLIATTFLLVITSISIAFPIGFIVAIFLHEYCQKTNKFGSFIRFILNTLASTPSIIFGMFGLLLFKDFLNMSFSILTAGLTLTIVVLPVIIKAIEDSLKSVPYEFREASLALGANKISTIFKVVIPSALSGIITSIILTIGRIIGESAPVYLTLGATLQPPDKGFFSSGQTLTTHILFINKDSPLPNKINLMYETSLITIVLIYLLNFLAKYLAKNAQNVTGVKTKCLIAIVKSKIKEKKQKKQKTPQKKPKSITTSATALKVSD